MSETAYDPDEVKPLQESVLFALVSEPMKDVLRDLSEYSERRLKTVDEVLCHFNSHDINHALRVIGHACEILQRVGVLSEITDEEAGSLLCACLLHDIGMGPLSPLEDIQFKDSQLQIRRGLEPTVSADTIDEWRKNHHLRIRNWIIASSHPVLKELTPTMRHEIAELACAHREISILNYDYFLDKPRLAFLAAVLRLADQMDITPSRIRNRFSSPRASLKIALEREGIKQDNPQLTEWLKVFAEKKWNLVVDESKRAFILDSEIWDDELTLRTLSALEELVEDIEETIEETKDVPWWNGGELKRLLPVLLDVHFKVKNEAPDTSHILRADYDKVWNYLVERLYSPYEREFIPVREAVCNAIDACLLLPENEYENAFILVEETDDSIRVTDNGVGLTKAVIENHLKVLGSSFYESSRFKGWLNKCGRKRPSLIGQFGTGAFSYLLVSNAFELHTKSDQEPPYRLRFSRKFGVTLPGSCRKRGTRLIIPCLKQHRGEQWNTSEKLYQLLRFLFPKPRIKLYFKALGREKILVGYYPSKNHTKPPNSHGAFEISEKRELDGIEVGLAVKSDGYRLGQGVLAPFPTSWDFITETRGGYFDSDRYPAGINPMLLYSGMRIGGVEGKEFPLTRALLGITSYQGLFKIEGRGFAWIDANKETISVNLKKSNIEERNPELDGAIEFLENQSRQHLIDLFKSDHIADALKFRAKFQIASGIIEPAKPESKRELPLISRINAARVYAERFVNNSFLSDCVLDRSVCRIEKDHQFHPLMETIRKHKHGYYYLRFGATTARHHISPLRRASSVGPTEDTFPILMPNCSTAFRSVLRYHLSSNGINVLMDSMVPSVLDMKRLSQQAEYSHAVPRALYVRSKGPTPLHRKLTEAYGEFISKQGFRHIGMDVLSALIDSLGVTNGSRGMPSDPIQIYGLRDLVTTLSPIYRMEKWREKALLEIIGATTPVPLMRLRNDDTVTSMISRIIDIFHRQRPVREEFGDS